MLNALIGVVFLLPFVVVVVVVVVWRRRRKHGCGMDCLVRGAEWKWKSMRSEVCLMSGRRICYDFIWCFQPYVRDANTTLCLAYLVVHLLGRCGMSWKATAELKKACDRTVLYKLKGVEERHVFARRVLSELKKSLKKWRSKTLKCCFGSITSYCALS